MDEVKTLHLPMLAWNWHDGRYVIIHDDLPIGMMSIDRFGRGNGEYNGGRWIFEPFGERSYRVRDADSGKSLGSLRLINNGGPEEGRIHLYEGPAYRCLRDARKIPPKVTITGTEGQPLLQFREEDENEGRIQIDNLPATSSEEFPLLVLWGLYLYLRSKASVSEEVEQTLAPEVEEKAVAAGGGRLLWLPWVAGGLLAAWGVRRLFRPALPTT